MQVNAAVAKFISTPVIILKKPQPNKWFVKNIYGLQSRSQAAEDFCHCVIQRKKKNYVSLHGESMINRLTGTMLVS